MAIAIGLAGFGKIATAQHLPALQASTAFTLVAGCDPHQRQADVPHFADLADMLHARADIAAVAVCTPPQMRHRVAAMALQAGKHVLLEKPPCATLAQLHHLQALAAECGVSLYATWHSRHAPAMAPARAWLADRQATQVDIVWQEDVRVWHPGQAWIWQPGGLGVFDPGINALSMLTHLLPGGVTLHAAHLATPAGLAAPITAQLALTTHIGAPITARFDFRGVLPQCWDITIHAQAGEKLEIADGGTTLRLSGIAQPLGPSAEYAAIYAHFAALIETGRSDVDAAPLLLVADAFLMASHETVAPFDERSAPNASPPEHMR